MKDFLIVTKYLGGTISLHSRSAYNTTRTMFNITMYTLCMSARRKTEFSNQKASGVEDNFVVTNKPR